MVIHFKSVIDPSVSFHNISYNQMLLALYPDIIKKAFAEYEKRLFEQTLQNEMEKKVYKVEDVQNLLGLGRSKAYEFIENVYYDRKPFRVLKIGRSYRIPCNSFDKWLNGDEERERVRAE